MNMQIETIPMATLCRCLPDSLLDNAVRAGTANVPAGDGGRAEAAQGSFGSVESGILFHLLFQRFISKNK